MIGYHAYTSIAQQENEHVRALYRFAVSWGLAPRQVGADYHGPAGQRRPVSTGPQEGDADLWQLVQPTWDGQVPTRLSKRYRNSLKVRQRKEELEHLLSSLNELLDLVG